MLKLDTDSYSHLWAWPWSAVMRQLSGADRCCQIPWFPGLTMVETQRKTWLIACWRKFVLNEADPMTFCPWCSQGLLLPAPRSLPASKRNCNIGWTCCLMFKWLFCESDYVLKELGPCNACWTVVCYFDKQVLEISEEFLVCRFCGIITEVALNNK